MNENEGIDVEAMISSSKEELAQIMKSLGHSIRLEIVRCLWKDNQVFIDLKNATQLSKTALVHHLDALATSGLIARLERGRYELTKDGREIVSASIAGYATSQLRKEHEAAHRAAYIQMAHAKRPDRLEDVEVQIKRLETMRVASVRVISGTPERDAWAKMQAWAEPLGLLSDPVKHPVFGFNNPDPQSGKREYGYEFWIRIYEDIELDEGMEIKEIEERLYAVITCNLTEELESTFFKEKGALESWKKLISWVKSSKYKMERAHCLEHALEPGSSEGDYFLDLYLPIKE